MISNNKKKEEENLKNLELRKQFLNLLEKLNDNNTREIGYKGLKELITNNINSYNALRIYLNSLFTFQTQNLKAKEIIILLFGYIGQMYKNNLLDPIDHPTSIITSINRIVSHIRNSCMKSSSYTILKACSYSIIEILDNCMPKSDINNINRIFLEPFINNINTSSNMYIKNGCCIYINDLIYHMKQGTDFDMQILECILDKNKFINDVIFKIKIDFYQNYFLYEALYNMILYFSFDIFSNIYPKIIYKMIEILESKNILKNETKISCLKVLYIIAKKIKENNINLINNNNNLLTDMRNCISNYIDYRFKGVRKVARDCSKMLNLIELEQKNGGDINDKINHRNMFRKMRDLSKQGKVQEFSHYDNMIVNNLQNDVYKKGVGNLLNLSNFIQKHTKSRTREKNDNKNMKYLKSNNVHRFDYINKVPIDEDDLYINKNENYMKLKNNDKYLKQNNNRFMKLYQGNKNNLHKNDRDYIAPTNIANTSKSGSDINYNRVSNTDINEEEHMQDDNKYNFFNNNYENKYTKANNDNKNETKFEFDPSVYYSLDINEICNSFNNSKKMFMHFEKKVNTKLYHNENKLIQIKNAIEENKENIFKYHNNILDETLKTNYTKTVCEQSMDSKMLLKTTEFNDDGQEYFKVYLKALNLYNNQNFNEAFSLVIDDDIYLLRLLFLAKTKLNFICPLLDKNLFQKILIKINHICHSHFLLKIQRKLQNAINRNGNNTQ